MKPLPLQFIAAAVLLVTLVTMVITARNNSEVSTPVSQQTSPTISRARKEATPGAALSRYSFRKESVSATESETIQEITHTSDTHSEEFWQQGLSEVHNNDNLPDRELGKKLITVASNPKAPEWARLEAMMDALVFTDDENYDQDIKPLAIRKDLPESLNDVILEDLLNRSPLSVLPAARHIANTSGHPLAGVFDEFVKSHEQEASSAY